MIASQSTAGQGAKGGQSQAIGRSRGGLSTKILALMDGLGNLVRFILMPGQRGETTGVERLMEGINCGAFLKRRQAAKAEVINDWGKEVANFFRVLQRHYQPFMDMMRFQIPSRQAFV